MEITALFQISLLIFALISEHLQAEVVMCPNLCTCNEKAVICENARFKKISKNFNFSSQVETLDISGNFFEALTKSDLNFTGANQIKKLYLNDSNVADIRWNTFAHFTQLELLDLSENILEYLPSRLIQENKKILAIKLSMNLFFTKTPELISNSLEILDLSQSHVEVFSEKNVMNLPNLRYLFLQGNQIKYINPSTFTLTYKLVHVELSYNPWRCNCSTAKLFDNLIEKKLMKIDDPIRCRQANKKFEDMYTKEGAIYAKKSCRGADFKKENGKFVSLNGTKGSLVKVNDIKETKSTSLSSESITLVPAAFEAVITEKDVVDTTKRYILFEELKQPTSRFSNYQVAAYLVVFMILIFITAVSIVKVPQFILKHRKKKIVYKEIEMEL